MKILHLMSGGSIGGIETLCRDIAELSREQNEFVFLYDGGIIAEDMRQNNIPVYFFYEHNLLNRIMKLYQLVKSKQYDVVIVHHEGAGIYSFYLMLLYCFRNIKFVKYLHCSFEDKYFYQGNALKDKVNYYILKQTLNRSHGIVAVSEYVKKSYCKEFGCSEGKVKVIYNGIRTIQSANKESKEQLKGEPVKLLYIGRLIEVKGVHILLRAVKKLIDLGESVELDILGDGPLRSEYELLSGKLGLKEKVHFQGYILDKQIFYENASIFVYPSVWQEAFGISVLEAMAQEMICVASNVGGIPEIIDDGRDGFLFQGGDPDKLTEVLLKAIKSIKNSEYKIISEGAKQKSQRFNINKTVNELQELCSQLLEE